MVKNRIVNGQIVITFPDPSAREVSAHPPHLLDSQGRLTPAALIPFCAYRGNLTTTGKFIDGLSFPVCNKFQTITLEGQLCYSLNISSILPPTTKKTKSGISKGIFLAIDLDNDQGSYDNRDLDKNENLQEDDSNDLNMMSIHINTMSRISYSRAGMYALTDLKKMTGTKSFESLPDKTKDCHIESKTDCYIRRYNDKAKRQCGCIPWVLSHVTVDQVSRGGNHSSPTSRP